MFNVVSPKNSYPNVSRRLIITRHHSFPKHKKCGIAIMGNSNREAMQALMQSPLSFDTMV